MAVYWRPGKGKFDTGDDELHLLLSKLGGRFWYQWSELLFMVRTGGLECCMLCGMSVQTLKAEEFEEHGQRHREQLGKELTAALMTMLYLQLGQLSAEQVRDVLGYDRENRKEKYAYWARSAK